MYKLSVVLVPVYGSEGDDLAGWGGLKSPLGTANIVHVALHVEAQGYARWHVQTMLLRVLCTILTLVIGRQLTTYHQTSSKHRHRRRKIQRRCNFHSHHKPRVAISRAIPDRDRIDGLPAQPLNMLYQKPSRTRDMRRASKPRQPHR